MKAFPPLAAVLAAVLLEPASAQVLYTETFDAAVASNAPYPAGPIPGTGVEVVDGSVWIAADVVRGRFLDLGTGWYTPAVDPVTQVGHSTARGVIGFDLQAGQAYTLSFDYSRQGFSAGNGPFDTAITVALGSHAVTYHEVAGFFYGMEWKPGALSFTPGSHEPGATLTITAFAPPGYSGMAIDNLTLVAAPVPEPRSGLLLLAGLGAVGLRARARRSARGG